MQNSKGLKVFLVISGLLLTFIGAATLFVPVEIKAASGIDISGNVSVLNDIRASAALILSIAILILLGAFLKKLTYVSSLVALLTFLSLGIGRLISITADGMPVEGMVKATGLEFFLGIISAFLFFKYQKQVVKTQ